MYTHFGTDVYTLHVRRHILGPIHVLKCIGGVYAQTSVSHTCAFIIARVMYACMYAHIHLYACMHVCMSVWVPMGNCVYVYVT